MPVNTAIKLQLLQERFKSNTEVYFVKALDDAMTTIMAKLIKTEDSLQKKRLKAIKALIEQEVHSLYSGVIDPLADDMTQFADLSYKTLFDSLNTELAVGYSYASLPNGAIKEIINMDKIILMGDRAYTLSELLHSSTQNQIDRYKQIITGGLASNSGYREITSRLKDANGTSIKEMRAVIHTAISSARSIADGKAYARFGDMVKGWESVAVLDSRTTKWCGALDGRRYFKSRGYEWENIPNKPPRHFRCLLGDTLISTRYPISNVTRRVYKGIIYTITTSNGDKIECTPNHPILTQRGFIGAEHINKTDKLGRDITDASEFINVDKDHIVTSIKDLFTSFEVSSSMGSVTMPLTSEDFHGDVCSDYEVDVVDADSLLGDNIAKVNTFKDLSFIDRCSHTFRRFYALGSIDGIFQRKWFSSSGIMSRFTLIVPSFFSHFRPFEFFGFTSSSRSNTIFDEKGDDGFMIDPVLSLDILAGKHGDSIVFDNIVDISFRSVSTHVYNLENKMHYYTANNLITHNCRSVLVSITGSKIDNTRSQSGDKKGQISDKIKFKDWFASQSNKFQKSYLGQGRYNLYKKGKFEINSFVDVKSGEVFTIQELKEMI